MQMNSIKEQERLLRALLRNNLSSFIEKVYKSVDNSQPYIHSKHIELIADRLEKCYHGKIKILIVNILNGDFKASELNKVWNADIMHL